MIKDLNVELLTFIVFSVSFCVTYLIIPKIIRLVHYKELMDDPNDRSSHTSETPTLGGVAFFVSLILGMFLIEDFDVSYSISIIAGLTVLFIIGLKDDLMVLSAKTKLIVQILAITFLLYNLELQSFNFHGFLNINSLNSLSSVFFSYFIIVSVINGYNLIDGIDGLASMVGIVIFTAFAIIFYSLEVYYFSFLSLIGIGFLFAFLRYNLSSDKKIFMGDTGSMIVGFIIGILLLKFLGLSDETLKTLNIQPKNALMFSMTILFVPFIDVIRVFGIRLMNKKKPFAPDRNHIHHILIDSGLSHIKASVLISVMNAFIILFIYFLNIIISTTALVLVFILLTTSILITLFRMNKNYSALRKRSKVNNLIKKKRKEVAEIYFRLFF